MVTDTVWLGSTAATAKLELLTLPETATEVWGEVSADGGRTWARWENFQLREDDSGYAAMFSLSDSSPRHFRVRTSNSREALYWRSDAFLLPENGTEDQGGNRGGSITPIAPVRTPAPVQSPEVSVTPSPEPTPAPAVPAPTPGTYPRTCGTRAVCCPRPDGLRPVRCGHHPGGAIKKRK